MLSSFVVSLRKLHKELSEFEEQTDSLFDLLPSKRAGKRGLCDGLGKLLSCVTGVVDRDEADELQANIQEMEAKEGDLKLEVSANKLMVKNILEQAVNNTEVTGSMARKLFVSDNSIAELKEWSAVETKLRALNFWVQKIKMDRGELRLGLENALNKRLSPESLAPKKLKTVLEAIEASIPKRFELITDKEGLEEFYAVVQVMVKKMGEILVVTLEIPLKKVGLDLELVGLHAIPIYSPEILHFVQVKVEGYIIISRDFKYFTLLSEIRSRSVGGAGTPGCARFRNH
nr:PREDICTED: uncharacterized protein LOC109037969 isoform X1 [Bemisia tabaci]